MKTLPYLEFQLAQARHQCPVANLAEPQRRAIRAEAERQWRLEEQILCSDEGRACGLDAGRVNAALAEIRARYADQTAYLADLAANGLDEALLRAAIGRALRVDAVLEAVAAAAPAVSMQDAEIFYWQHRARFDLPETRQARHILITVNETLPGKTPAAVQAEIASLAGRVRENPGVFSALALRHSECPTALQEGLLGWVPRGQLYPELDAALFAMSPGELATVASPLGWHLLRCDDIRPAGSRVFADVAPQLVKNLSTERRRKVVAAWLKRLNSLEQVAA